MKKQGWKEYFVFSRKERNGAIVIAAIIVGLMISPYFIPDKPLTAAEKRLLAEKAMLPEKSLVAYTGSIATTANREQYKKQEVTPFYFDPNTLSTAGWVKLGIPERTAQTIDRYRAKGGKFKKPEDLEKIYGLRQADLKRLLAYVRIEEQTATSARIPRQRYQPDSLINNKEAFRSPSTTLSYRANTHAEGELLQHERKKEDRSYRSPDRKYGAKPAYDGRPVEINKADSTALMELPGIGTKLAARILKFRNGLGGFYSVNQVREVYGIPEELFNRIEPLLICDSVSIQKININTAMADVLSRHPYISYSASRLLVQYRQQHGPFSSVDDLLRITTFTPEMVNRLRPYLITGE